MNVRIRLLGCLCAGLLNLATGVGAQEMQPASVPVEDQSTLLVRAHLTVWEDLSITLGSSNFDAGRFFDNDQESGMATIFSRYDKSLTPFTEYKNKKAVASVFAVLSLSADLIGIGLLGANYVQTPNDAFLVSGYATVGLGIVFLITEEWFLQDSYHSLLDAVWEYNAAALRR